MAEEDQVSTPLLYERAANESVSEGVIRAVATASGTPAVKNASSSDQTLEPLASVVDPDALNSLFPSRESPESCYGRVTFVYQGYKVTAKHDGMISVRAMEQD